MSVGHPLDRLEPLDFLRKWNPEGPWVLIAIDPKGKRDPIVKTFDKDKEGEAQAFICRWNGKRNLYFSINTPSKSLTSQARRALFS